MRDEFWRNAPGASVWAGCGCLAEERNCCSFCEDLLIMSQSFICTFLVTATLAVFSPALFADGCFVTDNYAQDVYAPDQKAVIAWDGATETIILSTKLQARDMANFGWIIPIKATEKPDVALGNAKIFYELSDYFKPIEKKDFLPAYATLGLEAKSGTDGVEVLETKKLDVYDITILRATDADQLYKWINSNKFRLPAKAKAVLRPYTNKDFFFITVTLDLLNQYKNDLDRIGTNALELIKIVAEKAATVPYKGDGAINGAEWDLVGGTEFPNLGQPRNMAKLLLFSILEDKPMDRADA